MLTPEDGPSTSTNYEGIYQRRKCNRLHYLQHQNWLSKLRLRSKIASTIESRSVSTDEGTSSDLEAIMQEEESARLCCGFRLLGATERLHQGKQEWYSMASINDKMVPVHST